MTAPFESGTGFLFDLSSRVKLCVRGADRLRFLNGQTTNDMRKASERFAVEACILSAKGKMNAHVFVSAESDCFFIDTDAELRESLPARLDRYVIADNVEIKSVSEQFSIFHVLASAKPNLIGEARLISNRRFVESGWDIWIEAARHDSDWRKLSATFRACNPDATEVFRIEQGIPQWGRELTEEIIPIEANLEERTIDYEKGCYIGQEVISRIKMSGQTNKRLCGLVSLSDVPLSPRMKLFGNEKEAGWITSATWSARLAKQIALGYVKRGFNEIGTKLDAVLPEGQAERIPISIVSLPFGQ